MTDVVSAADREHADEFMGLNEVISTVSPSTTGEMHPSVPTPIMRVSLPTAPAMSIGTNPVALRKSELMRLMLTTEHVMPLGEVRTNVLNQLHDAMFQCSIQISILLPGIELGHLFSTTEIGRGFQPGFSGIGRGFHPG